MPATDRDGAETVRAIATAGSPAFVARCRRVGDTNARTDATGATGCALTAGDAASWVWSEVWTEVWTWSPHQRGFSPPPPQGFAWGC
jgi:hypothetical protein